MDTADSLTAIRHATSMHDRVKEYVASGIDSTIDVMEDLLEYTSGNIAPTLCMTYCFPLPFNRNRSIKLQLNCFLVFSNINNMFLVM